MDVHRFLAVEGVQPQVKVLLGQRLERVRYASPEEERSKKKNSIYFPLSVFGVYWVYSHSSEFEAPKISKTWGSHNSEFISD